MSTLGASNTALPARVKAPNVQGGQILYLDFDGVLHHHDVHVNAKRGLYFGKEAQAHGEAQGHSHRLFEHAPLLIDLLARYPDVRIVLSTSWVRWRGYAHARDRLPAELAQRCVGATFHKQMDVTTFLAMTRGQQILADVRRREPAAWLAIDDDDIDWPLGSYARLARSDSACGIGEPKVCEYLKLALEDQFTSQAPVSNTGHQRNTQGGFI